MFTEEQKKIIHQTEVFVKDYIKSYDISHDFAHVIRVKNTATKIALDEELNINEIFEVQLGALTHDISDHKYSCDVFAQETILQNFFKDKLQPDIAKEVIKIACNVSLSKETSLEHNNCKIICKKLHCVQDADRIDSLGAIGISRYFAYGMLKADRNINDVISNIDSRSTILMKHIKTNIGKKIADKKYKIIKYFLDDYYETKMFM